MQASSFWAELLQTIFRFRKREKFSRRLFTSSIKSEIGHFPSWLCSDCKEMYKKRDALAELLFLLVSLLLFWRSRRRRGRGILKSLLGDSAPAPPSERRQTREVTSKMASRFAAVTNKRNFTHNQIKTSCSRNARRRWRNSVCLFDLNLSMKPVKAFFVFKCKLSLASLYLAAMFMNKL